MVLDAPGQVDLVVERAVAVTDGPGVAPGPGVGPGPGLGLGGGCGFPASAASSRRRASPRVAAQTTWRGEASTIRVKAGNAEPVDWRYTGWR